jgi:hypothetical protein
MGGAAGHLEGSCHCGAVHVTLELSRAPEAVELRACQCAFCRRHGARTLTDRDGRAVIAVRGGNELRRYRFGARTADYLICGSCGVYVAAVVDDRFATINAAGLAIPAFAAREAVPADYSGESAADRLSRRRARWMPVAIDPHAPVAARQKEACG